MDLRRLEHFLALHAHGTFTRAADAAHLSQSALSRSIQALEEDLGVPLFDRLGHETRLTPAGRFLLPGARDLLSGAQELRRSVALFRGGDVGEIRIGVSPTPGAVLLRALMVEATRSRPQLRIDARIDSNEDLLMGLKAEKFDLVVLDATHLESPQGYEVQPLPPQAGGFLVRAGHPLQGKKALTIEEITAYPVTAVSTTASFWRRLVDTLGPGAHPSRMVTHHCDSYEVQRDLALRTYAVILCLYSIVQEEISAGTLIPLSLKAASTVMGHYACVRLENRSSSSALEFVRGVIERVFSAAVGNGQPR